MNCDKDQGDGPGANGAVNIVQGLKILRSVTGDHNDGTDERSGNTQGYL